MKTTIYLDNTDHKFEKQNLITRQGGYDEYACKCGLHGRRYNLTTALQITGKKELIEKCPLAEEKQPATTKRVRITNFGGHSKVFANLTNGSEHDVVPCPEAEKKKFGSDIWVMGIGEPVRLLGSEYEEI